MRIRDAEFDARAARLAEHVREQGLSGAVLFDNAYVLYYTGFAFIPTERPAALVVSASGERGLFVPRLEREHAEANATVQHVSDYSEFPSERHPLEALRELLDRMGVRARIGADQDGYPWILGYRGPTLTELTGSPPEKITAFVEDQMAVKSQAEI